MRPFVQRAALAAALASSVVAGCTDPGDPLRERLRNEGVFSPQRTALGRSELVVLGQLLFFDRELSGNRNIACATCHLPAEHAADDRRAAVGEGGAPLFRNTLEPFNRSFIDALFWDGRVERIDGVIHAPVPVPAEIESLLEAQALLPMLDRGEMRGQPGERSEDGRVNELASFEDARVQEIWAAVMARLLALPGYVAAFRSAYPMVPTSELSIAHVARAIVAFEQHLWELTDTNFDEFLRGRSSALSLGDRALPGAELFFGDAGCSRCHNGPLLSDGAYHNIAVPQVGPGADGDGLDLGRARITGRDEDRYAFRTPPLRNVAITSPYMHNGAFVDLEQAIRHHLDPSSSLAHYTGDATSWLAASELHPEHDPALLATVDPLLGTSRELSDDDISALIAFLESLTSTVELSVFISAGAPAAVPSGLPVDGLPEDFDAGIDGGFEFDVDAGPEVPARDADPG